MKFLFFDLKLPALLKDSQEIVGGAAVQWKSWIKGFVENGHQFGLLTWKGAIKYIEKKVNIDIVESYDPNYGINKLRIFYYQIPQLYLAVKRYNPDFVIQASATVHTVMLMIVSKMLGIPFIHRIASDAHVDDRIGTLVKDKSVAMLYKLGLKYSDFLFAQNEYQYMKLKLKYPKKNIYIMHNPYEEDEAVDIVPRHDRTYISWIGNFRKIKNLPTLLNTAKRLSHINFKIAGKELTADPETIEATANLNKLSNVEFVGYLKREEVKSFLAQSIALLNTSFNEGFSNTFLEAWACGTPVVSTVNVNPDDIVTRFDLGKIADDFDSLPQILQNVVDCKDSQYDKWAYHCRDYVRKYHDPKILAEKFVSYLR
jgi:glycosyltransferase involved in cell wall biosynthesis